MEVWKHRLAVFVLVLCLILILAALWYCLFGLPKGGSHIEGTLVQKVEEMMQV